MKRSKVFLTAVLAVAIMAASVILGACGGGGGGGGSAQQTPKVQLSGTISSSDYNNKAMHKSLMAVSIPTPTVDKVLALPMERGSLNSWAMESSKVAVIGADGSFSFDLEKTTDWLLVLMDSSVTTTTGRFVGSIALNTGTQDSLLNMPATDSTLSTMTLGTVSRPSTTSGDAVSAETVSAVSFGMTTTQLLTMAKTDDLFKNAKNLVENYGNFGNGPTTWYVLRPNFYWGVHGSGYSTLSTAFSAPAQTFLGMSFQLDTNNTVITMNTICASQTTTVVELFPPAAILDETGKSYDETHPLTNFGATCTNLAGGKRAAWGPQNFMVTDQYSPMSYGFPAHFTSLPNGYWSWKENGTIRAMFDIGTANPPYYGPNNYTRGFVPSFKVNVGAANKILSVDVQWYYYDEALGQYVGPFDNTSPEMKVLKHFIRNFEVVFDVTNGLRRTCAMYFDPATTSNVVPGNFYNSADPNNYCNLDWYFNNAGFPDTDTGLMGFYETGGFGFFFDFFKP